MHNVMEIVEKVITMKFGSSVISPEGNGTKMASVSNHRNSCK